MRFYLWASFQGVDWSQRRKCSWGRARRTSRSASRQTYLSRIFVKTCHGGRVEFYRNITVVFDVWETHTTCFGVSSLTIRVMRPRIRRPTAMPSTWSSSLWSRSSFSSRKCWQRPWCPRRRDGRSCCRSWLWNLGEQSLLRWEGCPVEIRHLPGKVWLRGIFCGLWAVFNWALIFYQIHQLPSSTPSRSSSSPQSFGDPRTPGASTLLRVILVTPKTRSGSFSDVDLGQSTCDWIANVSGNHSSACHTSVTQVTKEGTWQGNT